MSNYDYVLAFDPSGSFHEGKGITGWCFYDCKAKKIKRAGVINSKDFTTAPAYWNAHTDLIYELHQSFKPRFLVIAEDYLLYADKAEAQINSRMETCRLLGILEHSCWDWGIPFHMQTASQVVNRWNNQVLEFKKILYFEGNRPHLMVTQKPVSRHTLDAIRHAIHYATFGIGKEKKNGRTNRQSPAPRADLSGIETDLPEEE